jgi:hypothetical protein
MPDREPEQQRICYLAMALHSRLKRLDQLKPRRCHGQMGDIRESGNQTKNQNCISERLSANQGIRHQPHKPCLGNRAKKKPARPNRPMPSDSGGVADVFNIA